MEVKMYYDRVISPGLEEIFKKDLKWLYDFVKEREDLDFLIGSNKAMESISVYRGLTRIIRIHKGKEPNKNIKIDAAKAYKTLAGSLEPHIFDNFVNFISPATLVDAEDVEETVPKALDHLKTLLCRISNDKRFDRYYDNKKEGYYQNILSRQYGINSNRDDDFVIIDKEVVFGYDNDQVRREIFGGMQEKYRALLKKISHLNPRRYGSNLENNAIGNELDFLAWKSDGTLLLMELKHGTSTSGIYLSPLQIGLYTELFEYYKKNKKTEFYENLKKMVEQKQRMGLIHKGWKIPAKISSIKPMLIISENIPKVPGWKSFMKY